MKVFYRSIIFASALIFFSCGTTSVSSIDTTDQTETTQETAKTPKPVNRLNVVDSVFNAYRDKVNGISITVTSSPKAVTQGRKFASPYRFQVLKADKTPAANFELTVYSPSARNNDEIEYTSSVITTNEAGTTEFLPEQPSRTFNTVIKVCPAGKFENVRIAELAKSLMVTAPFKVSTNLKSAGGTIAVVDFNASGKPITGNLPASSELLKHLMRSGFTRIGNAPVDITNAVITGDEDRIYSNAKRTVGSYSKFLIFGTVKFDSAPEHNENGYTCTVTGTVKSMNLADGSVTYQTSKTVTITDKNEWAALSAARTELAAYFTEALVYGM